MNDNLPPMPEKEHIDKHIPTGIVIRGYTAEQMQAYARAAIEKDRERQSVPAPQDAANLLARYERQWHRMGELWERHQGKGWPDKESAEFQTLRDKSAPATRAALLAMLAAAAAAPQPQPVQPTPTINDYLIVQSTGPLPADFLQFWQTINPKAMTRRVLALTAWNISKHEAKKQFKTMNISKTFDDSNAENLTILDLSDKVFLRDLSTQAKEMAESPGCAPAWAATYMALEASASMLADLIENTEVRDA